MAVVLAVAAAITGVAPTAALAGPIGGGDDNGNVLCMIPWPLNYKFVPYCE